MTDSLLAIGFMRPDRLWALLAIPVLLGFYLIWTIAKHSRSGKHRDDIQLLLPNRRAWKRHVGVVAAILTLASLTLAWAQPNGYINVPRERATVFLVMDVSLSMEATDVAPSRIAASQEAATSFVDALPAGFNVALVSFAGAPTLLVPPTTDHGKVDAAIASLQLAPSTAIGEGIYAALNATVLIPPDPVHPNDPAPAVIVLLSDGESNTGRPSADAAQQSKDLSIPVFTIAYGTDNGYIIDDQGNRNNVGVNTVELRRIAQISGGKAYTADSLAQLNQVYAGISRSIGYEQQKQEITQRFVGGALGLSGVAVLAVMSLAARWP